MVDAARRRRDEEDAEEDRLEVRLGIKGFKSRMCGEYRLWPGRGGGLQPVFLPFKTCKLSIGDHRPWRCCLQAEELARIQAELQERQRQEEERLAAEEEARVRAAEEEKARKAAARKAAKEAAKKK